ncbi:midasin [Diplogelasinospora grovesii]|uniref:Midasin n=1 Tax=Diplogelasinospora grovesii TaxID=303347 RepID=A0AAN6NAK3_9PEZI|nr:midasin [Diplogelasinospora grovesii]
MCSHHACFHDDAQPGQAALPSLPATNATDQENERPKTNRPPLSPVLHLPSFEVPSNFNTSLDLDFLNVPAPAANHHVDVAVNPLPVEDVQQPGYESPMPDTLTSWRNLLQSQPPNHVAAPPPIPPQCLLPSQRPPSTSASSQARYLRPFAGKGLETLKSSSTSRDQGHAVYEASLHDAARGVPLETTLQPTSPKDTASPMVLGEVGSDALRTLSDNVKSHEHRLDRLENRSFSVVGHDDCLDKHEHTDLRVTELESRVEEVEKILNDNGSVGSSRRTVRPDNCADDATASVVSVATNATARASDRAEVYSQLQALQAQVSQLQAASLPSYNKPWELEVVFLPFPLKGIWMQAREFPAQRMSTGSNGDEWTQMPNTVSRATPDPQSPRFEEWAGQSGDSNWLLPKAFAPGRIIDQRLRSRGLIKTVSVRGPDARSIQLAIHHAFEDVLRISSVADRSNYPPHSPLAYFLGLRQSWVPLRKIHKDSRLRFLTPAEMATPTLWDFTFLASSVVMKATGVHRLFVTQPEAYLQDHPLGYHAFESGWSWQKLRQLSRVYPDSQSSSNNGDIPEADAMEDCWAKNSHLDDGPSPNTSALSLRQAHQQRLSRRSTTSPSQTFFTGVESPILSNSPKLLRSQSPLIQRERKGSRPPHIRTNSLPPFAAAVVSPSQPRRRVVSHNAHHVPYERRSSPFVQRPSSRVLANTTTVTFASTSGAVAPKRRVGSRSPSLIPRNTPRWSRASMSRSPSLAPPAQPVISDERERRTTPFYYATPHSEAPYPYAYNRAGSRGPAALIPSNGYDPDMDEDMDDGGSSTDPDNSQMTNDADGSFGLATDPDEGDFDITVYEDEEEDDELDGVDTDGGGQAHQATDSESFRRPEDIPWLGIEDQMSDGENIDPSSQQSLEIHADDDGRSDVSSQPSEYPSTQRAQMAQEAQRNWRAPSVNMMDADFGSGAQGQGGRGSRNDMGFHIHEDGDDENTSNGSLGLDGLDTQWG